MSNHFVCNSVRCRHEYRVDVVGGRSWWQSQRNLALFLARSDILRPNHDSISNLYMECCRLDLDRPLKGRHFLCKMQEAGDWTEESKS